MGTRLTITRWASEVRPIALFAAAALGAGCADASRPGPAAQVTDSAGVRIVTYDIGQVHAPTYREVGEADLEIGVVDGAPEYAFTRIVDLALLTDGRLVVSDGSTPGLRIFDASGRHERTIGLPGEGPGEFRGAPTVAGVAGDTVFAWDIRTARLTRFLLDGSPLGSTQMLSGNGTRLSRVMRRASGEYLGHSRWIDPDGEPELHEVRLELDSVVVERLDAEGSVLDTLGVMADRNRARTIQSTGNRLRVLQAEPPYAERLFLETNGSLTVMGRSDAFDLELVRGAEPPLRIRVLGAEHPADADEIRRHQEARLRDELGDEPLDPPTRMLNLDFLPERLPAFTDVVVAENGDVWVARSDFVEAAYEWFVFSPEGELRGSVDTPEGARLLAVGPSYVVAVVEDDFDVPFVRRYPLTVPTPT